MFWAVQILTLPCSSSRRTRRSRASRGCRRSSRTTASSPRQFTNLGDRLVFSNGIIVLAGAAAFLIWIYNANANSLIHLYVIGVFTAFTLSQAGMVRYWLRTHGDGLARAGAVNGVGAAATGSSP